jgi:hypothetical protein
MPPARLLRGAGLAAALTLLPAAAADAAPRVTTASGATPAAIQPAVDAFRTELGTLNPNVAQSFPGGRREINWDGVPDQFSSPNAFPGGFFNANSPRGATFSTPGTGFQVSANVASGTPLHFGNIDPSYTAEFTVFSAPRLFAPLGSTVTDVHFFVPGTARQATTNAFGVVLTDADREGQRDGHLLRRPRRDAGQHRRARVSRPRPVVRRDELPRRRARQPRADPQRPGRPRRRRGGRAGDGRRRHGRLHLR